MIECLCIAAATTVLLLALSMVSLLLPSARRAAPAREDAPKLKPIAEDASRLLLELAVRVRAAAFEIDNAPQPSEAALQPLLPKLIDAAPNDWIGGRSGLFRRPRLEEALAAAGADRPQEGWLLVAARWSCQAAWESAEGEVAAELAFRKAAGSWGRCIDAFAVPGELEARSAWFAVPLRELDVASEACAAQWLRCLAARLNEACVAEADHPAEAAASLKAWRCGAADALRTGLEELAGRFEHAEGQAAAAEWHWADAWFPLEAQAAESTPDQAATPPAAAAAEPPVQAPAAASTTPPAVEADKPKKSVQDEISEMFATQTAPPAAALTEPAKDRRKTQSAEPAAELQKQRSAVQVPAEDESDKPKKSVQDEISEMFAAQTPAAKPAVEPEEQIAEDLREVAKTTAQGLQQPAAAAEAQPKVDPAAAGPLNGDDIAKLFAAAEAAKA